MTRTIVQIGPGDQGKQMSLADFDHAEGVGGYVYELSKGVITVMDVPDRKHLSQLNIARKQLYRIGSRILNRSTPLPSGASAKCCCPAPSRNDIPIWQFINPHPLTKKTYGLHGFPILPSRLSREVHIIAIMSKNGKNISSSESRILDHRRPA